MPGCRTSRRMPRCAGPATSRPSSGAAGCDEGAVAGRVDSANTGEWASGRLVMLTPDVSPISRVTTPTDLHQAAAFGILDVNERQLPGIDLPFHESVELDVEAVVGGEMDLILAGHFKTLREDVDGADSFLEGVGIDKPFGLGGALHAALAVGHQIIIGVRGRLSGHQRHHAAMSRIDLDWIDPF